LHYLLDQCKNSCRFFEFFFYYKKSVQYKVIEVCSIVFHEFSHHPLSQLSFRAFFATNIEITFKSFKSIHIRSNDYTFSPYDSQIILSASAALLLLYKNKTKSSDEYALYLILFLIVLNVKLC